MAPDAPCRQARQDHVAESLARPAGAGDIDRPADDRLPLRQLAPQRHRLVLAPAARQLGEGAGDFLEAGDVGIGHAPKLGCDARGIDDAVEAAAPLHVPTDDTHLPRLRLNDAAHALFTTWGRMFPRYRAGNGALIMSGTVRQTLQRRVVQRACDQVGGPEALAERLGMSTPMVRVWLTGALSPPPRLFFRIVDILQEADPDHAVLTDDEGASRPASKPPVP
jgi:hypothetical protein